MTDQEKREKVIEILELCTSDLPIDRCLENHCPYFGGDENKSCFDYLMKDALALLKAQEPVEPYAEYSEHTGTKWLVCGACNEPMNKVCEGPWSNYCPNCGRAVKWE